MPLLAGWLGAVEREIQKVCVCVCVLLEIHISVDSWTER